MAFAQKNNNSQSNRINKLEKQVKALNDSINKLKQDDGFFPTHRVDADKQHFVSFANAPSQLYGNMLNMLKFKNELDHA